jgi:hypothetical protein
MIKNIYNILENIIVCNYNREANDYVALVHIVVVMRRSCFD